MAAYNFQISNNLFLFYQEQFAEIALAGINSDDPLRVASQVVQSVNLSSFNPAQYNEVVATRDRFILDLLNTAEQIDINARSLVPIQPAFHGLSAHIREWTGGTLDEYLTGQGLKVHPTFAAIASLSGETISTDNIEEE